MTRYTTLFRIVIAKLYISFSEADLLLIYPNSHTTPNLAVGAADTQYERSTRVRLLEGYEVSLKILNNPPLSPPERGMVSDFVEVLFCDYLSRMGNP